MKGYHAEPRPWLHGLPDCFVPVHFHDASEHEAVRSENIFMNAPCVPEPCSRTTNTSVATRTSGMLDALAGGWADWRRNHDQRILHESSGFHIVITGRLPHQGQAGGTVGQLAQQDLPADDVQADVDGGVITAGRGHQSGGEIVRGAGHGNGQRPSPQMPQCGQPLSRVRNSQVITGLAASAAHPASVKRTCFSIFSNSGHPRLFPYVPRLRAGWLNWTSALALEKVPQHAAVSRIDSGRNGGRNLKNLFGRLPAILKIYSPIQPCMVHK
ncbi:MAG: hypothetical protein ACYDB8_11145 [Acidiferrobacterales bacterium]